MKDFKTIARAVIKKKTISTAKLQTYFGIGYGKSQRIMAELEQLGIVSEQEDRKPRRILVSSEQLEKILKEAKIESDTDFESEEGIKTVTIMKYQAKDGTHKFIVKDKFDIRDDVERLDYMNYLKDKMLASGEMKKHLWTKETVLF